MSVRVLVALIVFVAVFSNGCNKNDATVPVSDATPSGAPAAMAATSNPGTPASAHDSELIRQAVEDHLRTNKGINMSAMDMTVDSVTVDGDHAQANATFRVKGGGAAMAMVYSLERSGDRWVVGKSQPSNGEFVHPPMDKVDSGPAATAPPASGTPDVTDFLKNQSVPKSN